MGLVERPAIPADASVTFGNPDVGFRHQCLTFGLKYFRSGGAWSFLDGISERSALRN
jgi:hypothetical protein